MLFKMLLTVLANSRIRQTERVREAGLPPLPRTLSLAPTSCTCNYAFRSEFLSAALWSVRRNKHRIHFVYYRWLMDGGGGAPFWPFLLFLSGAHVTENYTEIRSNSEPIAQPKQARSAAQASHTHTQTGMSIYSNEKGTKQY